MKTKHIRKDNCPKVKSIAEKNLKLHHQRPLKFLSFLSLQRYHKRQEGIIFHTVVLWLLPNNPLQQANKSITCLGITQDSPTQLKIVFHKAKATSQSQWRRKWSTLLSLLHIQHQLITMIYCFLRLFMVRIFLRAANQAKKVGCS